MVLWRTIVAEKSALLAALAAKLSADEMLAGKAELRPLRPEVIGLLDQLAASLQAAVEGRNPTLLPEARLLAAEIGEADAGDGRDIGALVSDFSALHQSVLEFASAREITVSHGEHTALARGVNRATAEAVSRYALARDREVARAHAEHFAFLAHELRTPLSSIRMGLDLLDDRRVDAADILPRIRKASASMQELLDNEITSTRLSSDSALHIESVALDATLAEVVADLQTPAADRSIGIDVRGAEGLGLSADPRLLRSILTNLLSNAIKFTRPGGSIDIRCHSDGDDIVCQIADACGGLPEGKAAALFDPYKQVGGDRSGFGLGLVIVHDAVARHHGSISVRNRPGEGCTMVLRLPKRPDVAPVSD